MPTQTTAYEPRFTEEEVRRQMLRSFELMATMPPLPGRTEEDKQLEARLGPLLLEEALKLTDGQVLDLDAWLPVHAPDEKSRLAAHNALAQLGIVLRVQFVHPDTGPLPPAVLRELVREDKPYMHEGVELTQDNVEVQYARRPLKPKN